MDSTRRQFGESVRNLGIGICSLSFLQAEDNVSVEQLIEQNKKYLADTFSMLDEMGDVYDHTVNELDRRNVHKWEFAHIQLRYKFDLVRQSGNGEIRPNVIIKRYEGRAATYIDQDGDGQLNHLLRKRNLEKIESGDIASLEVPSNIQMQKEYNYALRTIHNHVKRGYSFAQKIKVINQKK